MTQSYEITVQETQIVTRRYLVEADSREAAEAKALKGDTVAESEPQGLGDVMERNVTEVREAPGRGSALSRVQTALRKPDAFTVHARLWGPDGLGDEREYAVVSVDLRDPGIALADFPGNHDVRFVPASLVFGLRIDSESDDVAYAVSDIRYDTDGETAIVDLPEELEIDVDPETPADRLEEVLGDAISERTGWCVKSFSYERAA
jgi:hypothetical protein